MKTNEIDAASSSRSDMLRDVREKKAAHTPGPWRVGKGGPNGCPTVGTLGGLMVCMVAHSVEMPKQRRAALADADLIAAATDLLDLAFRTLEHAEVQLANASGDNERDAATFLIVHAQTAIAKALGIDQALERAGGGE